MKRTLSFHATDDGSLLLTEPTLAFRVTFECERDAATLSVAVGRRVRIDLLDDAGHLLDSRYYDAQQDPAADSGH
jgi:hypothetical protein